MNTHIKKLLIVTAIIFNPLSAQAEEIMVHVKGMVCSFCAQGIKKSFLKLPEVEKVEPNLEEKVVLVTTKPNQTLSDESIKKLIVDSGYEVTEIMRSSGE
jgi:periplasmic mercuric ion binding protein